MAQTKAESDDLNARSFEYQQLKREADGDKTLYDELVRKIREADINAGFQNNNIRIADVARPANRPVFPNVRLSLLLAFLFSALVALGAAVLSDAMDTTLRDPEQASRYLGTDVIGVLPAVRKALQLEQISAPGASCSLSLSGVNKSGNGNHRNGHYRSISAFGEAIRALRNTIVLGDVDSRLRSVLITSATPAEGKTTAAVHLAVANALQGKKTLLVDGDLRRPGVHQRFGMSPEVGLTNVLLDGTDWRKAVVFPEGRPNLAVLPAGSPSHRAADLFGPRMTDLLDEFGRDFELVIFDGPPVLGFAETLQMATAANGVLVITRAGITRRKAVSSVLGVLTRVRANVVGVVLNRANRDTSLDGYDYYGHYRQGYCERHAQ